MIETKMELQKQQSQLLSSEMEQIKVIANKAGVSVDSILKYLSDKERNKVLSELAKNQGNTQIQIKE